MITVLAERWPLIRCLSELLVKRVHVVLHMTVLQASTEPDSTPPIARGHRPLWGAFAVEVFPHLHRIAQVVLGHRHKEAVVPARWRALLLLDRRQTFRPPQRLLRHAVLRIL